MIYAQLTKNHRNIRNTSAQVINSCCNSRIELQFRRKNISGANLNQLVVRFVGVAEDDCLWKPAYMWWTWGWMTGMNDFVEKFC